VFRVRDLRASLAYYVDVLGFAIDWEGGGVASVTRDRCCLFLCEGDQSATSVWAWIGVDDAAALHDELRARGALIRHPPTHYDWALEMQVADPDGNVLRLGSEPPKGEPVGEWLDASGRRWRRGANGRWVEVARGG
jgi:catechol 2,3-dioxygenase-like lactoylglutathione lyase family enzyme